MQEDIKAFVQGCLFRLLSLSGENVRPILGSRIDSDRFGELLQFDFIYVGESSNGKEYILILKDDFSRYCFFRGFKKRMLKQRPKNSFNISRDLFQYFRGFQTKEPISRMKSWTFWKHH